MAVTQAFLDLENKLMSFLLDGDSPILATLRQQYIYATVAGREFSGVGSFTNFEIPDSVPLVEPPDYAAGLVDIELESTKHGAGCVLFIRNGKISCLEIYTYDDPWPEVPIIIHLTPISPALPNQRNSPDHQVLNA